MGGMPALLRSVVVAAVIDGVQLRVPNWITFPMIVSGWAYSTYCCGWEGLAWSLAGTAVGLALLLAEVEGMSGPEIAEALAIPVGTVWTRLHAARRELRALLEGTDEA